MGLWDIARAVDVHGNTIKRRLQEMEATGLLRGMSLFPQSLLLGARVAYYGFAFSDPQACDRAAEQVFGQGAPGMAVRLASDEVRYHLMAGPDDDLDQIAEATRRRLGADAARAVSYRYWESPPITDLERRVLQSLHRNLFATAPEMAAKVGVTPKTVRRCMESLRDKKAFCVVPLVDTTRAAGLFPFLLDVDVGQAPAAINNVLRSFPDLCPTAVPTSPLLTFHGFASNQAEAADVLREMRSVPGVRAAVFQVPLDVRWQTLADGLGSLAEQFAQQEPWAMESS